VFAQYNVSKPATQEGGLIVNHFKLVTWREYVFQHDIGAGGEIAREDI